MSINDETTDYPRPLCASVRVRIRLGRVRGPGWLGLEPELILIEPKYDIIV